MEFRIPLSQFIDYLRQVQQKRRTFPRLDEVGWLLDNFKFDNETAKYEPLPDIEIPYTAWWRQARN
jgi:hypothetical protein